MEFKRYNNVNSFLNDTKKFLLKREVENNLMIGIANKLKSGELVLDTEPYFASIKENNEIILAAIMTPPKSLIISCEENDETMMRILIEKLVEENIKIPGIIVDKNAAKSFSKIYTSRYRCNFKKEMDMRIYKLAKINEVNRSNGFFRKATIMDVNVVGKWIYEDTHMWGDMNTLEKGTKLAVQKIKNGRVYLWIDNKPVSMAMKGRETWNTAVINGVYTHVKFRGKGYATACVAELSQLLLNSGYKYCSLFTDLTNPTSNSIYVKIGYEPVCDVDSYVIPQGAPD